MYIKANIYITYKQWEYNVFFFLEVQLYDSNEKKIIVQKIDKRSFGNEEIRAVTLKCKDLIDKGSLLKFQ